MILDWIELSNIRNISNARLDLDSGVNLIVGGNGDGKTSVLEGMHCLSSGRSFRHLSLDTVIQRGQDDCLIRGGLTDTVTGSSHTVATQRYRKGQRRIRVDGEDVNRSSELAVLLPVLLLHPLSVELLLGPPDIRRRFLNWGLFHVKQDFQILWQSANRCLKQRNTLLRSQRRGDLSSWTDMLVQKSIEIDVARKEHLQSLQTTFRSLVQDNTNLGEVEVRYQRGWSDSEDLDDVYRVNQEKDVEKGYTTRGFHRADVKITVDGANAADVCSRGELKILCWLLMIAQGTQPQGKPLYLVDDPAAELDEDYLAKIGSLLAESGSQVVVTGTDVTRLQAMWPESMRTKVFHVKHGSIKEQ